MISHANLTDLQREYLEMSQLARRRRQLLQRFWFGVLGGVLGIGFYIFATFRTEVFFQQQRVASSIFIGEVFGLFLGLLAMLADDLPVRINQPWQRWALLFGRIVACLLFGIWVWAAYRWFFLQFPIEIDLSIVIGGIGLAAGFVLRIFFKLPGWLDFLFMASAIYIAIYMTYNLYGNLQPLLYFDQPEQIFTIGVPVALLIALGANAPALYQETRALYRRLTAK
jgi:hypothetical protein